MKLSEAIREGGEFWTLDFFRKRPDYAKNKWDTQTCPVENCYRHKAKLAKGSFSIIGTIWHLWDYHFWQREQVADWIESLGY